MAKFTVQILNDKEFDSLPYNGISDSLGIADKEKGLAFVRRTGIKGIDDITLHHEIDHLISKHSNHQDKFGIMHKKAGPTIASIATGLLSSVSPWLGAAAGAGYEGYQESQDSGRSMTGNKAYGIPLAAVGGALGGQGLGGAGGSFLVNALGRGIYSHDPANAAMYGLSQAGGNYAGGQLGGLASNAISGGNTVNVGGTTLTKGSQGVVSGGNSLANTYAASQAANPALGQAVSLGGQTANVTGGVTRGLTAAAIPSSIAPTAAGVGINLLGNTANANKSAVTNNTSTLGAKFEATQPPKPFEANPNIPVTPLSTPNIPSPSSPISPVSSVEPASGGLLKNITKGVGDYAKNYLSKPENLLGLGNQLISAFTPQPEYQSPASVEYIRSKLLSGGSLTEQGALAKAELSNILKSTPQELYPVANDAYYNAVLRRTRESYAIAKKNLDAQYNLAGVYGSGEHLAAQAELQKQLTNAETDLYAQTEARNFELARTAKYQAIQESLGVDKEVMDDLVGLTGYDVQTAAMAYGAKVEDVKAIREALGTLGSELLSRSGGMNQQTQAVM